MTNLTALAALCEQAAANRRKAEWDAERAIKDEAVDAARAHAVAVLGDEAAATLGVWMPLANTGPDTVQAHVEITAHVSLRYTAHFDDGDRLDLVTHCSHCGHTREQRITSLEGLAEALANAGVTG